MEKLIEELKTLFDSIICLCADGPEFHNKLQLVDLIGKEAGKGYNICKTALQQKDSGDTLTRKEKCPECGAVCPHRIGCYKTFDP